MTKPFNPVELLARVKSQLRRYMVLGSVKIKDDILRAGDIELDDRARSVKLMGENQSDTERDGRLKFLMESRGKGFFARSEFDEKVWGEKAYGAEGANSRCTYNGICART